MAYRQSHALWLAARYTRRTRLEIWERVEDCQDLLQRPLNEPNDYASPQSHRKNTPFITHPESTAKDRLEISVHQLATEHWARTNNLLQFLPVPEARVRIRMEEWSRDEL